MVSVNKPNSTSSIRNVSTPNSIPNSSGVTQVSFDALKRKFQRVNQEIVKQNVMLQENLARNRQEHHQILQENVRLKGRIVALEGKLREAEGVCQETKVNTVNRVQVRPFFFIQKSIGDRIEILEAIGEHLIEVTKFLRILSLDENINEKEKIDAEDPKINEELSDSSNQPTKRPLRKHRSGSSSMQSIAEEEDCDVFDLTDHIGDVSLQDNNNNSQSPVQSDDISTKKTNNRKQTRRK